MNAPAIATLVLGLLAASGAHASGTFELPLMPVMPPPEGPVLSLAEALERARTVSPDIAVARERLIQADNAVSKAYRAFQPTLTANGSYTRNSQESFYVYIDSTNPNAVPENIYTQKSNALTGSLDLNWQIFNARAFPALSYSKDQLGVSEYSAAQIRRDTLITVCQTYLAGVQQKQLLLAAFQRAQVARDQAQQALARFEAGLLQRASLMKAKLDLVNAIEEAVRDTYSLRSTKSSLATLLDRHDTAFELAEPPSPAPEIVGAEQELLQQALNARPEMAAQLLQEQIAARVRTDAWAQFFPTVSINATARTSNADAAPGYSVATWAATLAISIPLYDGGFRYVQLRDADSQERLAKDQTRAQKIKIEDELRRALLDLESARALRSESEQSLEVAEENQRLTRAQFDAGTATQIEVSDAEASLFQSQAQLLQQKLNVQLSALQLARAVGAFDGSESGNQTDRRR